MRKPALPSQWPRLPRDVHRDLKGAAQPALLDDVAAAFHAAGVALDADDLVRARELLAWAKSVAPRSGVVREALGVALYRSGSFDEARSELLAYRRITGRQDQGHLLADCARAVGRHDQVEGHVAELLASEAGVDRKVEGVIVLAAARLDAEDPEGALAALARVPAEHVPDGEPTARYSYMRGDVLSRLGRDDEAAEAFAAVARTDAGYLDVSERLAEARVRK